MCTTNAVTRRCGLLSRRTNIAGSNIVAHAVVTMEAFPGTQGQGGFQKDCFFKGRIGELVIFFVVSTFSSVYPSML